MSRPAKVDGSCRVLIGATADVIDGDGSELAIFGRLVGSDLTVGVETAGPDAMPDETADGTDADGADAAPDVDGADAVGNGGGSTGSDDGCAGTVAGGVNDVGGGGNQDGGGTCPVGGTVSFTDGG